MAKAPNFSNQERIVQGAWFATNLAPHHGYRGTSYRVDPDHRHTNLAPPIRDAAEALFGAQPTIQWH